MVKADKIIKGGTFYCGRGLDNDIDFVAIKGNKILATGKEAELDQYVDDNTEIYQFEKDNIITAGFHDNHIHLIQAGILSKYVELYDCRSMEECGERIRDFAATIPDEPWVFGCGFKRLIWEDSSYPTFEDLDKYINDRPAIIFDDELHTGWLNSKAIEVCGITKDTPVTPGGEVIYKEDGSFSGILIDAAIKMAGKAFDFSPEIVKELINYYVDFAVEVGLTSISDMAPYMEMDLSYPEVHFDMIKNGEARIRVNVARNLFEDIDVYEKHRADAEENGKGFYRVVFMKQFHDGTPGNYTGWMLEEYTNNPGEKGSPTLDVEKMKEAVKVATAHDVSVRLHSCGDASCRSAMDAYEAAMKLYPESKSRHMIEHLESVDPAEIPRFAEVGVIASIQPEHCCMWPVNSFEEDYPDRLGERYTYSWPFKSIKETGGMLAGGSDCPVVPGNPYVGIFSGITRQYADLKMPEAGNPAEKLTIEDVLDMYTIGASYAEHREDELGTIEPGKLADITVTDKNLFKLAEIESAEIRDAKSLLTMVDGNIVYLADRNEME